MRQGSIFDNQINTPLASRIRPQNLSEFVGQQHLLGEGKVLRQIIEQDKVSSMILGTSWRRKNHFGTNYCSRN